MAYAKALVGGLIAFGGALLTALEDNNIDTSEWIRAGIAGLVAVAVVWGVPNLPKP